MKILIFVLNLLHPTAALPTFTPNSVKCIHCLKGNANIKHFYKDQMPSQSLNHGIVNLQSQQKNKQKSKWIYELFNRGIFGWESEQQFNKFTKHARMVSFNSFFYQSNMPRWRGKLFFRARTFLGVTGNIYDN